MVGWDNNIFKVQLVSYTDQVMNMLVCRIEYGAEMYVSFVYGENNSRARIELWKVLSNHKVVGNYPWLMLGDFSVILNLSEHSNIKKVNTDGTQDFRDCVKDIGMEDIKMNGLFYTWIQKMKNPELGIRKKLDRAMGNGELMRKYPSSQASFLPYGISNHCPILCLMRMEILLVRNLLGV